MKDTDVL